MAVGLTVLRQAETIPRQRAAARARASGLEAWLGSLPRDELLALVRELVAGDRQLLRQSNVVPLCGPAVKSTGPGLTTRT